MMVRPLVKQENAAGDRSGEKFYPANDVSRGWFTYIIHSVASLGIASRIVPFIVCLSLIPLILFFSFLSGWYIWSSIAVSWDIPIFLQYGEGGSPFAELALPPLSTALPYDISLHLMLPASETNFALGNFMATMSLSTPYNKTLATIRKPSIALPPPSRPILLFSSAPRLIDLEVPLLSSYTPGTPNVHARIDLGRRDGWKSLGNGEGRELSVWSASLRGVVRRHGIRGLVSRFPLTFAITSSAAFFSLSVLCLAACILPSVQRHVSTGDTSPGVESKQDRPLKTRKRPRKSTTEIRPQSTVYKTEPIPVDIPSGSNDHQSLKRRRSRTSDLLFDSEN